MNQSEIAAADTLRRLALDERLKAYVLDRPELYRVLYGAAARFIGGETLETCLEVARETNEAGHAVTIDFMGESTRDRADAIEATREFVRIAEAIAEHNLDATVSLDLSHIGLVIDEAFCISNATAIAQAAESAGIELMISAEGPERTDAVLRVHEQLCREFSNVGITLQAYLYRSPTDLDRLLGRPGRVRVVKGAFDAPNDLSMPRGADLDAAYIGLVRSFIAAQHACSVATHDPAIIDDLVPEMDKSNSEVEMLRGVTSDQLSNLQEQGLSTRVYLPYGREWYLYLLNRIAEYPPNIFDAIKAAADFTSRSAV